MNDSKIFYIGREKKKLNFSILINMMLHIMTQPFGPLQICIVLFLPYLFTAEIIFDTKSILLLHGSAPLSFSNPNDILDVLYDLDVVQMCPNV